MNSPGREALNWALLIAVASTVALALRAVVSPAYPTSLSVIVWLLVTAGALWCVSRAVVAIERSVRRLGAKVVGR